MFLKRKIDIELNLGRGAFKNGSTNLTIKEHALSVNIYKGGGAAANTAEILIYNMRPDDMAAVTDLGFLPKEVGFNSVKVIAYADDNTPVTIFKGDIVPSGAYADYSNAPNTALKITAVTGYYAAMEAKPAESTAGESSGISVLKELTTKLGKTFKNLSNKNPIITDNYSTGSLLHRVKSLGKNTGLKIFIDDDVIIACDADQPVDISKVDVAPLVNKDNGLIGYPSFSQQGINFSSVYNPALKYGGFVNVESVVPKSSGTWQILILTHKLTQNIPGGDWKTDVVTTYVKGGVR